MSSIAALPTSRTAPVTVARPRLQLVRPGFVPRPPGTEAARPVADGAAGRPRAAAPVRPLATPPGARAQRATVAPLAGASARASTGARARAQVPPRQRLTARGRAAVASLVFVVAATAAVGVGAWAGQAGAADVAGAGAGAGATVETVTVGSGETLWGIAAGVAAPGQDVRDVVDAVLALNGLASAELRAGQQILVPAR